MQLSRFHRVQAFGYLLLIQFLTSLGSPAVSRQVDDLNNSKSSGIRFQIAASIKADRTQAQANQNDDGSRASLAVKIRISSHATESQFFGEVTQAFSSFKLAEGSGDKVFWQDPRCHQRRGLPKTTVVGIDGSIETDNGQISVEARPRHLGMLLPRDEISAGRRLPGGVDRNGRFIAYRSRTNSSHLSVNVKIYIADCNLAATTPSDAAPQARTR
jgi:hypothetical protein